MWDETGDDCAGDIATALFTVHNGRYILVGLKSYAETDDEVSFYLGGVNAMFENFMGGWKGWC